MCLLYHSINERIFAAAAMLWRNANVHAHTAVLYTYLPETFIIYTREYMCFITIRDVAINHRTGGGYRSRIYGIIF